MAGVNNRVKITNDIELKDRLVAINRVTKVTKGGRSRLHRLHCYGRRLRCRIWTRFAQIADAPEASSSSFADVHPLMPFIERVAFFGDGRHCLLYRCRYRPSPEEVKLPKKASAGERKAQQPEWVPGASVVWAKRVRRRQRTQDAE